MRLARTLVLVFLFAACATVGPRVLAQSEEGPSVGPPESGPAGGEDEALGILPGTAQDRISLELKGVDVLDVLKVLAKKSGLNIVAGKNVRGQVTLFLQDVNVRDALDIILETAELAYEEKEGILKVITDKEYEAVYGQPYRELKELRTYTLKHAEAKDAVAPLNEIKSTVGKLVVDERTNSILALDTPEVLDRIEKALDEIDVPLRTENFQLRYAVAEDLQAKISEMLTPGTGVVRVDARTNKIVVRDRAEKIQEIRKLVESFDVPPEQVLIQAKIIEVELSDRHRYGIDWSYVVDTAAEHNILGFDKVNLDSPFQVSAPSAGGSLTTFTFGEGTDDLIFFLQLLERVGKTNTLSSPRLTVLNNQEARISVATREPFVSQTVVQGDNTSTTADNVQFVDVGVTMAVIPTITEDGHVLLKVKPEVSTQGTAFTISNTNNVVTTRVPVVTAQEVETTVLVRSGDTVVIGGLIQDKEDKATNKFPIVGDFPFFGSFFRSKSNDFTKEELVFFLTPTILTSSQGSRVATQEGKLYFDEKHPNQVRDFNEAGGFSFEKGLYHSQGIFRSDDRPYWKLRGDEVPQWRQGADSFDREGMLYNRPKTLSPEDLARRAQSVEGALLKTGYSQELAARLGRAFRRRPELAQLGPVEVLLTLSRDGSLEELSFRNERLQRDSSLADAFVSVVQASSPFPQFPSELDSPREQFRLTLSR